MKIVGLGSELRINTTTQGQQSAPNAAVLTGGKYVVAWQGAGAGDAVGIYQQVFNADGSKAGGEVLVNTTAAGDQIRPKVTGLPNGKWVVTWQGAGSDDSSGVFQQVFNADGTRSSGEIRVNTTTAGDQGSPVVAALDGGQWVVAWAGNGPEDDAGIFQQTFHADGSRNGGQSLVNDTIDGIQKAPSIAAVYGGKYVVVWEGNGTGDGSGVFERLFSTSDNKIFGELRVNTTTSGAQYAPSVTTTDRGWTVAWQGNGLGDGNGIFQQSFRYAPSIGILPSQPETLVNSTLTGDQIEPHVSRLASTNWAYAWSGNGAGDESGIFLEAFDPDGLFVRTENETRANGTVAGEQRDPIVTPLPNGEWLVTWWGNGVGDDAGIFQQRFKMGYAPVNIHLLKGAIAENAAGEAEVGQFFTEDRNRADTFTYTLVDNAEGRFAIRGDKLLVRDGGKLDFEKAPLHHVSVRVTDSAGLSLEKRFEITVTNVSEGTPPQRLTGSRKADKLVGGPGDDKLYGKLGADALTGGAGRDVFVFDTKPNKKTNLDKITDFSVKDDAIWLDNAVFKKLGKGSEAKPGKLKTTFFKFSDQKQDKDDYVIYGRKTGVLSYDADGSGKGKAVEFAILKKNLKMTAADFFVI